MPEPNFPNRTLAIMDNLEFLRATDNDLVHLGRALQTALELQRRHGKQESPAT